MSKAKHDTPDERDERDNGPEDAEVEVEERRARGAAGKPAPEDYNKGEYHGLTPQQIKKIEDARGDKEPSPPPETGMPATDTPSTGLPPEEVAHADRDDADEENEAKKRRR